MERERQHGAEECVSKAVANTDLIHEKIRYECFHGCVSEKQQRRGHAVNEGLANDERRADRTGIEDRGANADHVYEIIRANEQDGNAKA